MPLRFGRLLLAGILVLCSIAISPHPAAAQEAVGLNVGDTSLELSGQSSPGAYITVISNGAVIGTLVADANGQFSHSFPAQTPGITQLDFTARDVAGHSTDTVSTQVNLQFDLPTDVYIFLPTSLTIDPLTPVVGQPVHISGQTRPDSTVTLQLDDSAFQTAHTNADGSWLVSLPTAGLSIGTHQIFATVNDGTGNQSYPTALHSFAVSPQPVIPPTAAEPRPLPITLVLGTPTITNPTNNAVVSGNPVIVSGKGPSRAQIEVWSDTQVLGSVLSDLSGNWQLPLTLSRGQYTLRARACNGTVCGAFSSAVTVTFRSAGLTQQKLQASLNRYSITDTVGNKTSLHLQIRYGTSPYGVSIIWGDNSTTHTTLHTNDALFQHTYTQAGKYSGHVILTDPFGRQDLYFTVDVESIARLSNSTNNPLLGLIVLIILLMFVVLGYWRRKRKHTQK